MLKIAISSAKRFVRFLYHDLKIYQARIARRFLTSSSITESHIGRKPGMERIFAVYVIWQPKHLPWYVKNTLSALNDLGVSVVVVVNHPLSPDRTSELEDFCAHILVRNNAGFDMGGYKDASSFIRKEIERRKDLAIARVCYLNDSVYCFREGSTELFQHLAFSSADIAAPFENHEYAHHIQSFCFSVSARVFLDEAFQAFWANYLPVNSRVWAIDEGEKGLSRVMGSIANSVDIFYTPEQLSHRLGRLALPELQALRRYLPLSVRPSDETWRDLPKPALLSELSRLVALRSQIHTGAFLYQRFMNCPLMKRDLYYRNEFSLDEIEKYLNEVRGDDHLDEVLFDQQRKGSGRDLSWWNQARFVQGLI